MKKYIIIGMLMFLSGISYSEKFYPWVYDSGGALKGKSAILSTNDIATGSELLSVSNALVSSIALVDIDATDNANAISALDIKLTSTNSAQDVLISGNQSSISALSVSNSSLNAYISSVDSSVNINGGRIDDVVVTNSAQDVLISTNQADIAANDSDISNLNAAVGSNDSDISALNSAVNSNDVDILANYNSIISNSGLITSNDVDILANYNSIISNSGLITSNDVDILANYNSIISNSGLITSNDVDISALNAAVTANDVDILANYNSIDFQSGRITSNDGDISALNAAVSSNDSDIANLFNEDSLISTDVLDNLDAINANTALITSKVDDTAYSPTWDGVTTVAPSKNAVYDKINALPQPEPETYLEKLLAGKIYTLSNAELWSWTFISAGGNGSISYGHQFVRIDPGSGVNNFAYTQTGNTSGADSFGTNPSVGNYLKLDYRKRHRLAFDFFGAFSDADSNVTGRIYYRFGDANINAAGVYPGGYTNSTWQTAAFGIEQSSNGVSFILNDGITQTNIVLCTNAETYNKRVKVLIDIDHSYGGVNDKIIDVSVRDLSQVVFGSTTYTNTAGVIQTRGTMSMGAINAGGDSPRYGVLWSPVTVVEGD